jgi:hypothetical protein
MVIITYISINNTVQLAHPSPSASLLAPHSTAIIHPNVKRAKLGSMHLRGRPAQRSHSIRAAEIVDHPNGRFGGSQTRPVIGFSRAGKAAALPAR